MRDVTLEDTFYILFSTRAFATGIPGTLGGVPVVSAYEDNSATQITAGVTLGVDHDCVTGLNLLTIVATAANGFEAGKSYHLVITTGTVGGVSVVGEIVEAFTIGLTADNVWNAILTGSTYNTATSAGRRLRTIDAAFEVHSGTAQAGGAATITLDTGASSDDSIYNGDRIIITEGTGAQEHGIVIAYDGCTNIATMAQSWVVQPDSSSVFVIVPADVDVETVQHVLQTGGDLAALITTVDGVVDTILVDTNELQGDWTNAGRLDTILDSILADTGELQVDWVNGGRLDLIVDAILTDTGELQSDDIPGAIAGLVDLSAAEVATEISDALRSDTLTATPQGAPATTPTFMTAVMLLYDALAHKIDIDSGFKEFYNNAGTVIWKKALSDDASNYVEAESETGP